VLILGRFFFFFFSSFGGVGRHTRLSIFPWPWRDGGGAPRRPKGGDQAGEVAAVAVVAIIFGKWAHTLAAGTGEGNNGGSGTGGLWWGQGEAPRKRPPNFFFFAPKFCSSSARQKQKTLSPRKKSAPGPMKWGA